MRKRKREEGTGKEKKREKRRGKKQMERKIEGTRRGRKTERERKSIYICTSTPVLLSYAYISIGL